MKNPIDIISRRWRRKQEREEASLPPPKGGKVYQMPTRKKPASPSVRAVHVHDPAFSKQRRRKNNLRRMAKLRYGRKRKPHGRRVMPGPRGRYG